MSRRPELRMGSLLCLLFFCLAVPASAQELVFSDIFDDELGEGGGASGGSGIGYADFANWTVTDGTVDLIGDGDYAPAPTEIECFGSTGKCVDLDGATNDAGVLTSMALELGPGDYELSFELAGVASSFTQAAAGVANVVDWSVLATPLFGQETREQGDPYATAGGQFTIVTPTVVQIQFANQGGDNFGAMLDEVTLVRLPDPEPEEPIVLDIKPLSDRNYLNLSIEHWVRVALLGSETFDVEDVDDSTLAFGPHGAGTVFGIGGRVRDINEDGFADLVTLFWVRQTGIEHGDTEACLTAETFDGTEIEACDEIHTIVWPWFDRYRASLVEHAD